VLIVLIHENIWEYCAKSLVDLIHGKIVKWKSMWTIRCKYENFLLLKPSTRDKVHVLISKPEMFCFVYVETMTMSWIFMGISRVYGLIATNFFLLWFILFCVLFLTMLNIVDTLVLNMWKLMIFETSWSGKLLIVYFLFIF
jgi:hypothetical protein